MKRHIFVVFVCSAIELLSLQPAHGQTLLQEPVAETTLKTEASQSPSAVADAKAKRSPLISVSTLAEKIAVGEDVCLLEVGAKRESYDQGHIKGAQYVDWVKDITDPQLPDRYNILDQVSMEALMSKLGATDDSHIVVYDRFSSRLSTRMYWTLKVWGHDRVQVLDGGFSQWLNAWPTTDILPSVEPTNYQVTKVRREFRAEAPRVTELAHASKGHLIDGRPVEQFTGEKPGVVFHTRKPHQKKGHIPGAVSIPWKDNLNADGTFKSAVELKKMYAGKGVERGEPVIAYCNEGLHAAMPWFVVCAILEFENASVYDDSMAEWANSDRPVQMEMPRASNK